MKLHSDFRSGKIGEKNCLWLGLLALVVVIVGVYFFFLKHPGIMKHHEGPNEEVRFNVTVSQGGDGDFRTISEAIQAAPSGSSARFFIRVSSGVYDEVVVVPQDKVNIVLVGDGAEVTRVTARRSEPQYPTSDTATFTIFGDGFMAQGITFENTASSDSNQAVALLCSANYTIFYQCRFLGYHDTLYAKQGLQFYRDCDIYGTVDFIFGFASAVFQNCNLYARMSSYQKVTYTAQGRSSPGMQSGFTLQGCKVTVSPEVGQARFSITGFLGRPWFPYSTVMVMESFLDSTVDPVGWEEWPDSPVTYVTYLEFRNWGPGADTSRRVRWPGHKVVGDESDAVAYTASRMIRGDEWIPQTGIPYSSGFLS